MFFSKNNEELKSILDIVSLPNISFGSDPLTYRSITREVAGQIVAMVSIFQNKTLLIKFKEFLHTLLKENSLISITMRKNTLNPNLLNSRFKLVKY